ncbi:MAG: hypothetical protein KOO63_15680 [Bacteroidales bacterium]|nr:hypothetical protein [Candidatus Latescibacterota bacterium]
MERIHVEFQNCYGIGEMNQIFDASNGSTFLIYAPNGVMKSCFARVFDDVSRGENPRDEIFPQRSTSYIIRDEEGTDIPPEQLLVVNPFDQNYSSEKTATLMLSEDLRRQYGVLVGSIQDKAATAISALAGRSGIRRGVETELLNLSPVTDGDLFACLESLSLSMENVENPGLEHIQYLEVFNEKVLKFLSLASTSRLLGEYVERYEELVSNSLYFRRGVFNHTNATSVHKVLQDNGFFAANHSLSLADRDNQKTEIATPEALQEAIEAEKQQILNDPELANRFEKMDKLISRNVELRRFRDYLENNPDLIPRLLDLEGLKRDLWLSYAFGDMLAMSEYLSTYRTAKLQISELVGTAKEQETEWRRIVDLFHSRFSVPFKMKVINQDDVILKDEAPTLIFEYCDGDDVCEVGSNELQSVLSTGEQRALYLLNVIFEIEARKKMGQMTVLVLDDVADSFDYKNKYAIIEYLKDIQGESGFFMLILSHNFDFFRTVQSRLGVGRQRNCFMAIKNDRAIKLVKAEYFNPFRHWKSNLHQNRRMMLATIPMARNLVEYTCGQSDDDYLFLTSLLHMKSATAGATMSQLANVLNRVMNTSAIGGDNLVLDAIYEEAESCTNHLDSIQLENKVVLSIAIRLLAEEQMIDAINDSTITGDISSNQTRVLYDAFCEGNNDVNLRRILDRVILMTPDTIHLNSFMYEPILDMSDIGLHELYLELKPSSLLG